jgi:uncharacterized protein involved in outer membrane biogenesis
MLRRLLVAVTVLVVVVVVAAFVMTRAVFGSDRSRVEIVEQLSRAFGRPVKAASITASPLGPTITLDDVTIGETTAVHADRIRVRTGPASLFTRWIDGAAVTITGLRAALPLPPAGSNSTGTRPLSLSRLGALTLVDAEVTTHGRRLRIDGALQPHDAASLTIGHATIDGDDMHADVAGEIADLATWKGDLRVRGDALDGDVLRSLAWDLLDQPPPGTSNEPATSATGSTPLALDIDVHRMTLGPVVATGVKASGAIGRGAVVLDPVSFSAFGGAYKGQMALRFEGGEPSVRWYGEVSNINLSGLTASASGPAAITGVLAGDVDLTGTGVDFARALTSVRGSARITLIDGRVGKLGLARSILAAASPRPQEAAENASGPADTPFKRLSTALTVSGGSASLIDVRLESDEVTLVGGGGLRLDGSAVTVFADVQLSDAGSNQLAASRGRTLDPGLKLTVPVTIRGNSSHYQVSVELSEMTTAPLTTDGGQRP